MKTPKQKILKDEISTQNAIVSLDLLTAYSHLNAKLSLLHRNKLFLEKPLVCIEIISLKDKKTRFFGELEQ